MRVLIALSVASLAAIGVAGSAIGAPPAGTPGASASSAGGRPDFAGSGRPDFAGQPSSTGSSASSSASSNGSSRGNSSNAGSFPSNSNAGGGGLTHGATAAQPALQAVNQAFSDGEISAIREFFTARAHANKPEGAAAASEFRRGQKLSAAYLAEPLPADLLAQLPNRPGLTYVRVGNDVLLLAGPDDVIVDVLTDVFPETETTTTTP
jgi:hypothetical protein